MRRTLTLALLVLCMTAAAQSPEKKYPSLLWEITGNGMTKPSYLYGTMHISRKLAFHLSDTFFIALKKCDVVALENDMDRWMEEDEAMSAASRNMMYEQGYSLYQNYWMYGNRGFYRGLVSIDRMDEAAIASALKTNPPLVNHLLYRTNNYAIDYEEDTYLDHFIFQAGRKLGKQVVGLEEYLTSRKLVDKAMKSQYDYDEKNAEKEADKRERARMLMKGLSTELADKNAFEEAYRRGDLDLLDSLHKLLNPKEDYNKYMLHERNVIMAQQMDSIMKKKTLFTGVGAAHLPGDKGVIELLRRMGYTVRPVTYTDREGNKTKTDIDRMRVPLAFSRQQAQDSAFSVETPVKLFLQYSTADEMQYLATDMANGSYYFIRRFNHYGGLTGLTGEKLLKKLDSLLYENLPGKILSRKNIRHSAGYPGIDVVSRTSGGNVQRSVFYVTPEEFYIFKMSGIDEYVNTGTEADRFFSSISFRKTGRSGSFTDPSGALSARFPGTFAAYEPSENYGTSKSITSGFSPDSKTYCLLLKSSSVDYLNLEEDTFELNFLAEVYAVQNDLKLKQREAVLQDGYPALDAVFENDSARTYARFIVRGADYIMALGRGEEKTAKEFIASLKLGRYRMPSQVKPVNDTTLHFSVETRSIESPYNELLGDDDQAQSLYYMYSKKEKKNDLLPVWNSRTYRNTAGNEKIVVSYSKEGRLGSLDKVSKEKKDKNEFELKAEARSMRWRQLMEKDTAGYRIIEGMMTDTGSSRALLERTIEYGRVTYQLKAPIDTISGPSPFVRHFFNSFTPTDTFVAPVKDRKLLNRYVLDSIYAADSVTRENARQVIGQFYYVHLLEKEDFDDLKKAVENKKFLELELNDRMALLRGFGAMEESKAIPFLRNFYRTCSDSASLQLSILSTIGNFGTAAATKEVVKLMDQELPVTSNDNDIRMVFMPYYDSLELAQHLFPGILEYARYPEYRPEIYSLLAKLVKNNLIKKQQYAPYMKSIADDALYDVRLYLSSKASQRTYAYNYGHMAYDYYQEEYEDYYGGYGAYEGLYGNYDPYGRKKHQPGPEERLPADERKLFDYVVMLTAKGRDPKVLQLIEKINLSRSNELIANVNGYLMSRGWPVADSIWKNLEKKEATLFLAYSVLHHYGKDNMLQPQNLEQEKLVRAKLLDNRDLELDTMILYRKIETRLDSSKAYVYVFKWRPKDRTIWKMAMSGPHPDKPGAVEEQPEITVKAFAFDEEKKLEEEIESNLRRLRVKGHSKASAQDLEKPEKGLYNNYLQGY